MEQNMLMIMVGPDIDKAVSDIIPI
jgi:hypothetical protein